MIAQRNPNSPRVLSIRPLTRADLETLRQRSARPALKALRDSHHRIARLFASGLKLREISEATGYTISRLSILRADPSMEELIARYRGIEDEAHAKSRELHYEMIQRTAILGQTLVVEQLEDAVDSGEKLPLKVLLAVTSDANDRVGYMKRSASLNANVDFAKKLEDAIRRSREAEAKTIEGKAA